MYFIVLGIGIAYWPLLFPCGIYIYIYMCCLLNCRAGPAWLGGPRVLGRAGLVLHYFNIMVLLYIILSFFNIMVLLYIILSFDNMFQNAFKCDMVSTTCSKMPSNATWFRQHVPKCSQMRHGFDNMFQNALKCDMVSTTCSKMLSNATWFRQHVNIMFLLYIIHSLF